MNETNEAELKPCDKCGCKPDFYALDGKWWTTHSCVDRGGDFYSKSEAIAAWNTRHQALAGVEKLWCAYCGVWGDHQSGWCWKCKNDQVEVQKAEIAALNAKLEVAKEALESCETRSFVNMGSHWFDQDLVKEAIAKMEE